MTSSGDDVMKLDLELMGKRLRRARKLLNLTQEQLAERIECSKNYISLIERGEAAPSVEFIISACNALGGTPDHYLLGTKNQNIDRIEELLKSLSESEQERCLFILEQYNATYH